MSLPFRHALIMAAGRGNRMRPLTDVIPKALAPYKGEALITHSLRMIARCVEEIHITVGYKSAMLAQHVVNLGVRSILITEGHPNSWWIHQTLMRNLDEPVVVLTCDNIVDLDFEILASDYARAGHPACMLVPVTPIPGVEGDYIDHADGLVTRLQRREPRPIYCSGIQVLNPGRIAATTRPGGDFYAIWDQLITQRQLRVSSVYPKHWFTVDTLEQLMTLG
jgi:NDP-sugar pyrophosphorylase family protein